MCMYSHIYTQVYENMISITYNWFCQLEFSQNFKEFSQNFFHYSFRCHSFLLMFAGPCTPGELVWVDCNLCTCNRQGQPNPVCAAMWCQPAPKNKPLEDNNDILPEMWLELEPTNASYSSSENISSTANYNNNSDISSINVYHSTYLSSSSSVVWSIPVVSIMTVVYMYYNIKETYC